MTGASKILTVSYGTFSCTLEGFDDPFNTMKAIAEYFRDLAAEDRYFGAEPPTPDAAMLHRIAEREIQRRVEAKVQENGIVLRAADGADQPDAPFGTAPVAAPVTPRLMDQTAAATESVAEKLSRLRADVAGQLPAAAAQQAAPAGEHAPATVTPVVTAAILTAAVPPARDYSVPEFVAPDFGEEDGYDLPASVLADHGTDAQPLAAVGVIATDVPDDTALADTVFTGVVSDTAPTTVTQAAFAAPEPAATDALLAGIMAGLAQTADAATPAAAPASTEAADEADLGSIFAADADQDMVAAMSGNGVEDATASETVDLAAFDMDMSADDTATMDSIFGADAAADDAADEAAEMAQPAPVAAWATEADDDAPDTTDLPEADTAMLSQPVAQAPAETGADLRPDASDKLQRARARVIRIRRSDSDGMAVAPAPAPAVETASADVMLSAEAEADLAAELAALRAATDDADDADDADETANDIGTDARRAFADSSADATISRLMAQADEHLEGPESKRRLSAIAHLKAAVAATVAERRATGPAKDTEPSRLSRYRDDLARAVRGVTSGDTAPPERPAPLVLVSEQRIDRPRPVAVPTPQARPAAPAAAIAMPGGGTVMPRRLTGSAGLAFAQDDDEDFDEPAEAVADARGFVEFAEQLGATSLAELIEASAAYLACVEGRDQFTRPQLMGLVQVAMPNGEIPREDGLRSFGTLLRTGRIAKIRRGQFALSETSGYLAEGKRIAG